MKPTTLRTLFIFLLLFLGLSALGGGALLIVSPSAKLKDVLPMRCPKQNTTFNFAQLPNNSKLIQLHPNIGNV